MDFEGEPLLEFFGLHLQPNKAQSTATHLEGQADPSVSAHLHVTQVALGQSPKPGRTVLFAVDGSKQQFALGALEAGRVEQFSLDLMVADPSISFLAVGSSDVYLTGYKTISLAMEPSPDFEGGLDSDEEEDDDELPAPQLVSAKPAKMNGAAAGRTNGLAVNEFPMLAADGEDSDDDDDDDSDDDDGLAPAVGDLTASTKAQLQALAKSAAAQNPELNGLGDDDDDEDDDMDAALEALGTDEEDDEDSEDEEGDDDDDELTLPAVQPAAQAAAKRPAAAAAATAAAAPAGKKQKGAKGTAVPIAAAAAAPAAAKAPKEAGADSAALKTYVNALKAYITQHGATRLSELGSKVKRPTGVSTKMGKAISDSGLFTVDASQQVSLK